MPSTPKSKPSPAPPDTSTKSYAKTSAGTPTKARTWTKEDKIKITIAITEVALKGHKLDWDAIAGMFEGRTRSQTCDQWRHHILPSLKKTGFVGGH